MHLLMHKGLVAEVEGHRASRLIDLNTFLKMSQEPGVIILELQQQQFQW